MDTTRSILKLKNVGHIMEKSVLGLTNSFIHYISLSVFVLKTNCHSERGQKMFIVQSKPMMGLTVIT